jgi:hypothetical protein
MKRGSSARSSCARVFSARAMRHGTTRLRKKLFQPSNSTSTGQIFDRQALGVPARRRGVGGQAEPEEAVRRQRQQVGQFADRREAVAAQHLHRHAPL